MPNNISLKKWSEMEKSGEFNSPDLDTMIEAGWADWYCSDTSLFNRFKRMRGMIITVAACPFINSEKVYVNLFNSLLSNGNSYDNFTICDLDTERILYFVCAKDPETGSALVLKSPKFDIWDNLIPEGGNANMVKTFFKKGIYYDI